MDEEKMINQNGENANQAGANGSGFSSGIKIEKRKVNFEGVLVKRGTSERIGEGRTEVSNVERVSDNVTSVNSEISGNAASENSETSGKVASENSETSVSSAGNKLGDLKTRAVLIGGIIKKNVSAKFGAFKASVVEKTGAVKAGAGEKINDIKTGTSEKVGGFKSAIDSKLDSMKSTGATEETPVSTDEIVVESFKAETEPVVDTAKSETKPTTERAEAEIELVVDAVKAETEVNIAEFEAVPTAEPVTDIETDELVTENVDDEENAEVMTEPVTAEETATSSTESAMVDETTSSPEPSITPEEILSNDYKTVDELLAELDAESEASEGSDSNTEDKPANEKLEKLKKLRDEKLEKLKESTDAKLNDFNYVKNKKMDEIKKNLDRRKAEFEITKSNLTEKKNAIKAKVTGEEIDDTTEVTPEEEVYSNKHLSRAELVKLQSQGKDINKLTQGPAKKKEKVDPIVAKFRKEQNRNQFFEKYSSLFFALLVIIIIIAIVIFLPKFKKSFVGYMNNHNAETTEMASETSEDADTTVYAADSGRNNVDYSVVDGTVTTVSKSTPSEQYLEDYNKLLSYKGYILSIDLPEGISDSELTYSDNYMKKTLTITFPVKYYQEIKKNSLRA